MDSGNHWKLAAGISIGCITGAVTTYFLRSIFEEPKITSKPRKWIRVGNIKKLIIYPIKSCQGVELSEVIAAPIGLKASANLRDRIFMIVDYRYVFQTQRQFPKLALIHVTVEDSKLTVTAPGMMSLTINVPENVLKNKRSCRVWDDKVREVLDCGDEIGKWIDTYLEQKKFRLVFHAVDKTQRTRTPLQEKFPTFFATDKGSFQDQTSYIILAEESIADLNKKLEKQVSYKNFRPSILIEGILEPFAEDYWTFVRLGNENGPIFKTSKPCTRCTVTTVDPNTGEFDEAGEPLKTLIKDFKRSYANDIVDKLVANQAVIGLQLGLHEEGSPIKVGDPVYAAAL